MSDHILLLQVIDTFESKVQYAEFLFKKKYDLKVSPLLAATQKVIPKKGILLEEEDVKIKFMFHGRGCEVEFDDCIIDYDYFGNEFIYMGFGGWKLYEFVHSMKKGDYERIKGKDYFFSLMEKLENDGLIMKLDPPYATYKLTPLGRELSPPTSPRIN